MQNHELCAETVVKFCKRVSTCKFFFLSLVHVNTINSKVTVSVCLFRVCSKP